MSTSKEPSQDQDYTPISELGEFGLIQHLTQSIKSQNKNTIKGVGDDASVIGGREDQSFLLTTDYLVEDIHFDMVYTPLKHLGYKAAVVNFSDIYAMNAHPQQLAISLALSSKYPVEALEELYKGIRKACEVYNVDIIGGDTTSSLKGMIINGVAVGQTDNENIVYRSKAQPGDVICVTGDLGGAHVGLLLMEREKEVFLENPEMQPELEGHDYIVERILKPEARKDIVELFEEVEVQPNAMIDVSDGVSSDMLHICQQSEVGCMLYEEDFPIDDNTYHQALEFDLDPTVCFLNGGEDYELLFTLAEQDFEKLKQSPDITKIGEITGQEKGCKITTKSDNVYELKAQGWNPIRQSENS